MYLLYGPLFVVLTFLMAPSSSSDPHSLDRRRALKLDCARFVFAPQCRGVAAKRGSSDVTDGEHGMMGPEILDNAILKSFLSILRNRDSEQPWQSPETSQESLIQNWLESGRNIWQQNDNYDTQAEQ